MKDSVKKGIVFNIVSVIILAFLVIGSIIFTFIYNTEYKLTDTGVVTSPDGKYSVVFQMVGEPAWPFGATTVKVTVREVKSNKPLKVIDTSISDDGAVLSKHNWDVVWESDKVQITLKGSEQEDELYVVPLQ